MTPIPLLIALLGLAACAAPRETAAPLPPGDVTATTAPPAQTMVEEEPVEGAIPDGINPLTKEQADAVAKPN